jgi:hypothetical protein
LNIVPRFNFCGILTVLCSEIRFFAKPQSVNQDFKLPHIQAIHQLQIVYYELTGDVLNRQPPFNRYEPLEP